MIELFVEAIGIAAPGLPDWPTARAVLRGETPYLATELPQYQPQMLQPNERRRVMPAVRQAFRVAEEAVAQSGRPASELATVFASSEADVNILHRISSALAETNRVVSPTDFHNSVHNAAAGYWTIAVGARRVSTTLCAFDCSFAATLLEAATLLADEEAVLMSVYDVPPPVPLYDKRPISVAASVALIVTAKRRDKVLASLQISRKINPGSATSIMASEELETLRQANPALRALPLLQGIACGTAGNLTFENVGGQTLSLVLSPLA